MEDRGDYGWTIESICAALSFLRCVAAKQCQPRALSTGEANPAANKLKKVQQRGGGSLEHSCRSLNENVTRAVLS
jgi:hypothetical protein